MSERKYFGRIREVIDPFDPAALSYKWRHTDPSLDRLCTEIQQLIIAGELLK